MPISDPRAGRLFVWLISCFILLSLATGGAFLVVYMTQPDPATFTWLLYSGMALVCFPWSFWFMLCLYRCISRSLGLRIVCGGGGGRDGAGSIGRVGTGAGGSAGNGDGRHVKFGEAVVVNGGSGNDNNNDLGNIGPRSSSSSSSNNDISFKSYESEIPLASAMAS